MRRVARSTLASGATQNAAQRLRPCCACSRNEDYPVTESFRGPAALQLEREAVTHFGLRSYGVHLNGYVRRDDGLSLWVPRRSRFKPTWPGLLDNTVAGG